MNEWTDTSLRYRHWRMCFERLLQAFARWQPGNLFDIAAQPILEYRWIDSYTQLSLRTQFKVATVYSISHPVAVLMFDRDWYPMYYPERMKAWVTSFGFLFECVKFRNERDVYLSNLAGHLPTVNFPFESWNLNEMVNFCTSGSIALDSVSNFHILNSTVCFINSTRRFIY